MKISISRKQMSVFLVVLLIASAAFLLNYFINNYITQRFCSFQKTCDSCINIGNCGWCEDINKCKRGTADGPNDGSCSSDKWIWKDDRCPLTIYNFYGINIPFRADLYKANDIPLYPNNETINNMLWNLYIENLTIVWINSSDNSKVGVEGAEIALKMGLAYAHMSRVSGIPLSIGFNGEEINSYENLSSTPNNIIIALIPPILSNETVVNAVDNVIYIKGKTFEEFDLATIKFLMVALGINL